jgi:hypothetical protein
MARSAEYWLKRAEEVRTAGEGMSDETSRTTMFWLAAEYEELAKRARVLERRKRASARPQDDNG